MQTNSDFADNVPRKKRSSDEVSWAVRRFKKRLAEELNGICPSCQKILEYKVLSRRSLMRHIDSACAPKVKAAEESLSCFTLPDEGVLSDVQLPGAIDGDEPPTTTTVDLSDEFLSDNGEEASEQSSSDDGFEMEWEQDFLDNASAVQVGGARMTGAQIRATLSQNVNRNIILAHFIDNLLSKEEPLHVMERHLELARLAAGEGSIIPPSMHLVRRALQLRSLQSTSIHICSRCCRYGWKPSPRQDWPQCADDCECAHCTCPLCKENDGLIVKRFNKTNAAMKPNMVRSSSGQWLPSSGTLCTTSYSAYLPILRSSTLLFAELLLPWSTKIYPENVCNERLSTCEGD